MKRIILISIGFIIFGAAVLIRMFYLQIICYDEFLEKANAQEFYTVQLRESVRGNILDCNNISITADNPVDVLLIVPILVDDPELLVKKMIEISDFSEEKLLDKIIGEKENGETVRKQPFIAKSDLSKKEAEAFENMGENGIYVILRNERYYRDLPAQHLIGALGMKENTTVGLSGLEYIYDPILSSGEDRKTDLLVDEKNRLIVPNEYADNKVTESLAGHLELTIDINIQRAAESALGDLSGAVVIMNSKTSDVLALVSSPKYDPYFVTDLKSEDAFMNKTLQSYPPASLLKIFVAAVALEEGIVAKESAFYCDGSFRVDDKSIVSCWDKDGHGILTFEDSLSLSCNPVYAKLAIAIGKERFSKAFSEWELDKDRLLGYPMNLLSSLNIVGNSSLSLTNAGLGESGVFLTPINVAKMINVVATGGYVSSPRIVRASYDENGILSEKFIPTAPKRIISQSTANILTDMMVKTFQTGTGKNLNLDTFDLAGKTGSSETGNVWVGGFFPYDDPQYTVVVLITGAESGAADGGPVMKKICGYLGNYDAND